MDTFARDDLDQLLGVADPHCVSIYLPTARHGAETLQGAAQLRKLLRAAEARLAASGISTSAAAAILQPAAALVTDPPFWQHQAEGLALFLAPGFHRRFRLPESFPPRCEVGARFAVRPLLPLLLGGGRFYVLALSINQVRLLEASRDGARRVDLAGVPTSMEETLGPAVYYSDLQVHSAGSAALGHRAGIVHGHGDGDEEHFKDDLFNYFRRLAQALAPRLADPRAPLVVACVEAHAPLFRAACDDARLVSQVVTGSPDALSDEELRARAWPLAEPRLLAEVDEELRRYRRLEGSGRTLGDLETILAAAAQGRVLALFLARQAERWGSVDPETGAVRLHEERTAGDQDLLELVAVRTADRGGAVYALDAGRLPEGRVAAATLRY
jgi:hypothetical protein